MIKRDTAVEICATLWKAGQTCGMNLKFEHVNQTSVICVKFFFCPALLWYKVT